MRKYSLFSNRSLLGVAMLVAGSIGGLYSCQKKPQEAPAPALAPSPVEAVHSAFDAAGHDRALTQAFGDSARLRWVPDWHAAYTKPGRDGMVYTYVPLTPTLLAASTGRLAGEFRMVGTQRFLIAKLAGEAYSFDLATYTVAKPAASAQHRTLAEAAAQPMAWAAFSGTMTLHGLTTARHAVFSYQNGALVTPQKPAAAVRKTGARATGSYECITIYTCYWTAFCTRNGSPVTYGAMTQGINGCDSPGQEACGIDNWGMSWDSSGTDISESCTYVEDPPMPDPSPNTSGLTNPSANPGNTNPCNTLKSLGADAGFNQLLGDLKVKTALDHEEGYTYTKTANAITNATLHKGLAGGGGIDLQVSGKIDGYMHTHYSGLLSIFSASDMRSVYELYKNNSIRDATTFSAQVITANGTTYALTITDPAALVAFGDIWFVDGPYWQTFELVFYDKRYNIKESNSNAINEAGFTEMLAKSTMGLSLSKGDSNNFGSWSSLSLDTNQNVVSTTCP